ncbi:MAG: type II toxin-antitoxin system RelE/ParE family toxin [Spirochaetaceae bacterium]|nr:type II toxin-antitoxin system RelE/ParE family toxin [Spirochaetaceae bacterium]
MARLFKDTWFVRFAADEGVGDDELKELVERLEQCEAKGDLGGGVYKQRVARSGGGKSDGYRVIVYFKSRHGTFFVYGFAGSDRENIRSADLEGFRKRPR